MALATTEVTAVHTMAALRPRLLVAVCVAVVVSCGDTTASTPPPSDADRLVPADLPANFEIVQLEDLPPAQLQQALESTIIFRRKVNGRVTGQLTLFGFAGPNPTAPATTVAVPPTASTVPNRTTTVDGKTLKITTGSVSFAIWTDDVAGCTQLNLTGGGDSTEEEGIAAVIAATCDGAEGQRAVIRTAAPAGYDLVRSSVPDLLAVHHVDTFLRQRLGADGSIPRPTMVGYEVIRTDKPELLLARLGDLDADHRKVGSRDVRIFDATLEQPPEIGWTAARWSWLEADDIVVALHGDNMSDTDLERIVAGLEWMPKDEAFKLVPPTVTANP